MGIKENFLSFESKGYWDHFSDQSENYCQLIRLPHHLTWHISEDFTPLPFTTSGGGKNPPFNVCPFSSKNKNQRVCVDI